MTMPTVGAINTVATTIAVYTTYAFVTFEAFRTFNAFIGKVATKTKFTIFTYKTPQEMQFSKRSDSQQ
jgi:hypothetical protein